MEKAYRHRCDAASSAALKDFSQSILRFAAGNYRKTAATDKIRASVRKEEASGVRSGTTMRRFTSPLVTLVLVALSVLSASTPFSSSAWALAGDSTEQQIVDLAGEWEVTYTNGSTRLYKIDNEGHVTFGTEGQKGQIKRKGEALLLEFDGDDKIERLTMGTDGRMFVEHFPQKQDLLDKKATIIGIGIRQK